MPYRYLLLLFTLLFTVTMQAQAEQYRQFGDYRIHYSAFKSDLVNPEIAKAHGLTRSRYRAIVNITVQKKDGDNGFIPVRAKIEGTARDIYSKVHRLEMEEIREGAVIYYLAELPIVDEQRLTFDIRVIPEGENNAHNLSFERQFFVN
ncbi:MAG: DUF4426 domain-containing protein [Gammaproteobacteria bacterium]|nr:DUF4426 domain-containing protein [Gammaproteobacteria bacterium]MCW8973322.1 DUF4426 domain-containing protein [Gammaproteobacteria bacterium]MCW8992520.1 DUF4426 domain-containing protein [Gammaproteobacteria bacterium]